MSLENNTSVVLSSIDQMPIEVLVAIFKFITPNELAQICVNVSIEWKELITSCIPQPILRNLSLCSHEIKQKLISMGWSDDNNELQSADKNDPELILSLFERHKRKYYLYNFKPEEKLNLSKIIKSFGFMVHEEEGYESYESDITHVIVPNSITDWFKILPQVWILWAFFTTRKTFVYEDHLHKCETEKRITLETPFIPKSIKQVQTARNHQNNGRLPNNRLLVGTNMNVDGREIQKVEEEMRKIFYNVEWRIVSFVDIHLCLRELRRQYFECNRNETWCLYCKDIPNEYTYDQWKKILKYRRVL